jgi:glycosyltransferase involved in cell wall biosynthesis
MRYLWDMYHEYFRETKPFVRYFMKRLIPGLRIWDVISANMVDCFVANSEYVAKRIKRYYNRDSVIIHPPVNVEKYMSVTRKPQDYYLFFGQFTGYKRADIAIDACVKSGRKLVVAGAGINRKVIKKYSNNGLISFRGRVCDEEILNLYAGAKALLFPGIEDFGIIPVEANAAGCPVIAYRQGGALDSLKENVTGVFFDEQKPNSLIKAMDYFESQKDLFNQREPFTTHVKKFSAEIFKENINRIVSEKIRI